jgi:hypothetical protein
VHLLRFWLAALALCSASALFAALETFTPQHQLLGVGAGRAEMTPEILRARTDRMIQSQTFTIMREPNSSLGAERITGPRLSAIFRSAAAESGWPASLLGAIAYLESWGDPQATSPAGPRGLMQFSEATARAAGLRIVRVTRFKTVTSRQLVQRKSGKPVYRTVRHKTPYTVTVRDDRLNPERAAPAAAHYLARLETKFGGRDWAIFAYHCGEGCVSDLLPLTEAAVHHPHPAVAEMFFAASPARNAELYQVLEREMQRDYSPTYWFRIKRAEELLALYQSDPAAFRELAEDYQNPIHPQRRATNRLMIWLKSLDIFYRSSDDLRLASGKSLARILDDPPFFGFSVPETGSGPDRELYLQDSPAAIGTLLYVAFETRRLFEELKPKGEHFVPLQVAELVSTSDRPAEAGTLLVDPEFPEHSTGQVFDIDRSNLPRGERECLNFTLDDMGWDGYLGFIQVTGDTMHIGFAPSSREFFTAVFEEAAASTDPRR